MVEPDIVYCIDVFNVTDRETEGDHLISNCSVFETHYHFTVEHPYSRDIFQFTVTPRSNVEGARTGISKQINAMYLVKSKFIYNELLYHNYYY